FRTLGSQGNLTFPWQEKEEEEYRHLLQRSRTLQRELEACLRLAFSSLQQVRGVHDPACYDLPERVIWHLATLHGSGIEALDGHWTRNSLPPEALASPVLA